MFKIFPIKGGVCAPKGFVADGYSAGLKGLDADGAPRLDIGYIHMQKPCKPIALFTKNAFAAAPIEHFRQCVEGKESNFILINTKNANAMTGKSGIEDIKEVLANLTALHPQIQNPIMCSTGVIGVRLPKEKIIKSLSQIRLDASSEDAHNRAAKAIMTTDRFEKEIALEVVLENGKSFRIGAMAKGAGMIAPSLATMLCFITTDAVLPENEAREILESCVDKSFNAISVDGDMSTNDSVLLLSSGESGAYDAQAFKAALELVLDKLAKDIVRDGEGASTLVGFRVCSARSLDEARRAAKALSNSLLVKTAIFGGDPNWGRIASTIGASGVACDASKLSITIGGVRVYERGEILFDEVCEKQAADAMRKESFLVECDLGMGEGEFIAYGCDLGYEYVKINADYRS